MNRFLPVATIIVVTCLSCVSLCRASEENTCEDPCGKPTAWDEFNVFELKMTVAKASGYAFWKGRFDKESLDIQIDVETSDGKNASKGKIILIGGRVLATQGPITESGYEIDALDAPVLQRQLIVRLLGAALPNGPPKTQGIQNVDFSNEKTGIQYATPSAQGFIRPPWRVHGHINILAPDEVEYQLALTAATEQNGVQYAADFTGRLFKIASAKIEDNVLLDEWHLFGVGVQTQKEASGAIYDYGAGPTTATYRTVSDVRKKIVQENYAGELDRSKNFEEFWKEHCEEAWGLQIMHYGSDGKYSVTFCGPGGCGTAGQEGKNTFITKDPDYEVVDESEIRIRRSDGWDTYYRCTTDTHPILKYKDE